MTAQPDSLASWGNEFNFQRFHLYGLFDWVKAWHDGEPDDGVLRLRSGSLADTAAANRGSRDQPRVSGPPYAEPASYLKLREITLEYDLPLGGSRNIVGRGSAERSAAALRTQPDPHATRTTWGSTPRSATSAPASGRGQEVTPYPPARSFFISLDLGF